MRQSSIWVLVLGLLMVTFVQAAEPGDPTAELLAACKANNLEAVQVALEKGADINQRFLIGEEETGMLIHMAVAAGNRPMVEYLLDQGADFEVRRSDDYSPFLIAIKQSDMDMTKFLVERGANIYAMTSYGQSAFSEDSILVSSRQIQSYLKEVEREKYHLDQTPPSWCQFVTSKQWSSRVPLDKRSAFREYILNGGEIKGVDRIGNTSLHFIASTNGYHKELLAVLVEQHHFDVNAANYYGETPLHAAVHNDCVEAVEYLLAHGADAHTRDKEGNTPLNTMANAFSNGPIGEDEEMAITKMLLERRADVNAANVFGITALAKLADDNMAQHLGLVKLLLDHGADVNYSDYQWVTPLHRAAELSKPAMVKLLMEAGARLDFRNLYGKTPLEVVRYDRQEKLDIMCAYKKDICVIDAVRYGQDEILERLVVEGADKTHSHKNYYNANGVIMAVRFNDKKMLEKCIELGFDINAPDTRGYTALHCAVEYGYDDLIWVLLNAKAEVHIKDNEGRTAYAIALAGEKLRTIQLFKDFYPDIDNTMKEIEPQAAQAESSKKEEAEPSPADQKKMMVKHLLEMTDNPLHKAVLSENLEEVGKILNADADGINLTDSMDSTPLMYAVFTCNQKIVVLLVTKGAQVNLGNNEGVTPLHIASSSGDVAMVQLLLKLGADPSLKTAEGLNPMDVAELTENQAIAKLIKDANPSLDSNLEQWKRRQEEMAREFEKEAAAMEVEMGQVQDRWRINSYVEAAKNPFHIAVINGDIDAVKKQLDAGADVNGLDDVGRMPLGYAAALGNTAMVQLLVENGAKLNQRDNHYWSEIGVMHTVGYDTGWGAIHYAVAEGNIEIMKLLVSLGADVHLVDKERNYSSLGLALRQGKDEMVKALVEAGADLRKSIQYAPTALHYAVEEGSFHNLDLLLDMGMPIDVTSTDGVTPMMAACSKGNPDMLLYLIKHGANVNAVDAEGNNALHDAMPATYTTETIRIMVEYGIDVNHQNNKGKPPLFEIFNYGSDMDDEGLRNNVQVLLDAGADLSIQDQRGGTLLHLAAENCSYSLMKMAVEHGADVNAGDKDKCTPLIALIGNHSHQQKDMMEMIRYLIENGADMSVTGHNEYPLLHLVVLKNNPEMLKLFLEHKADVNIRDQKYNKGKTALHLAVSESINLDIARMLIKYGADINAQDENGNTPLHEAATSDRTIEAVKLLLEAGARTDIQNKNNQTVFDIVKHYSAPQVKELLASYKSAS